MGYSHPAGVVIVCDARPGAKRIARVLGNDPRSAVVRHADAGYEKAIEVARAHSSIVLSDGTAGRPGSAALEPPSSLDAHGGTSSPVEHGRTLSDAPRAVPIRTGTVRPLRLPR